MGTATDKPWVDPGIADEPPPELYRAVGVADGVEDFASVTEDDVRFFEEEGYLVLRRAFSAPEVAGVLTALLDLVRGKHPEYAKLQFEAKVRDIMHTLSPDERQDAIRKVDRFLEYDPRLKAMAEHPPLVALLTRLLGAAPELLWDQALFKPPLIGREKPWHQDNSMFSFAPTTRIVGVWIALDEATVDNGCMHIVPSSHRAGPAVHFKRRDFQICDTDIATERVLAVPLEPGGCLLFDGLTHHGTPPNHSSQRRRSIQFHFARPGARPITEEERAAIWGSEGKNVIC